MKNLRNYIVAILCSTAMLAAAPTILYVGGAIWFNNIGGPLNLVIIPVGSAFLGLALNLVLFLPFSIIGHRISLSNSKLLIILGGLFTFLFMPGFIWFFGFHSKAHSAISVLLLICVALLLYLLIGLFTHLFVYLKLQKWDTQ